MKVYQKWTLERCKEDALKYSSKAAWRKHSPKSHAAAFAHRWYGECTHHLSKPVNHQSHSIDECKSSALRFSFLKDWIRADKRLYSYATRKGWRGECCAHMLPTVRKDKGTQHKWTLDICKKIASSYSTRPAWRNGHLGSYQTSYANGWLDLCCPRINVKHSFEECKKSALKYKARAEWQRSDEDSKFYQAAKAHHWLSACCAHMDPGLRIKGKTFIIYLLVFKDAVAYVGVSRNKLSVRFRGHRSQLCVVGDYLRKNPGSLLYGWVINSQVHPKDAGDLEDFWMKQVRGSGYTLLNIGPAGSLGPSCEDPLDVKVRLTGDAKKYASRMEWMRADSRGYSFAWKHGWLDELCAHMPPIASKYTKDACVRAAKTCVTREEFYTKYGKYYRAAQQNGWLDECFAGVVSRILKEYQDDHITKFAA